jgi:hypothetical protein
MIKKLLNKIIVSIFHKSKKLNILLDDFLRSKINDFYLASRFQKTKEYFYYKQSLL